MKVRLPLFIGGLFLLSTSLGNTPSSAHVQAQAFCYEMRGQFEKIATEYGLDYTQVMPIIYPELLRFSAFSDQMETTALEYLYVRGGIEEANFSIGRFQMKPSFIEALENEVSSDNWAKAYHGHFSYTQSNNKAIRGDRVERLSHLTWQIHYLCLFYKVLQHKYPTKQWNTQQDQLSFYAAAYNYGFNAPEEEIENWKNEKTWYDAKTGIHQSYAEIAGAFYLKIKNYEF